MTTVNIVEVKSQHYVDYYGVMSHFLGDRKSLVGALVES
jgi:hypothetical protein